MTVSTPYLIGINHHVIEVMRINLPHKVVLVVHHQMIRGCVLRVPLIQLVLIPGSVLASASFFLLLKFGCHF